MENETLVNKIQKLPILRLIFIILGVVIFIEILIGLKTFFTPIKFVSKPQVQTVNNQSSIGLSVVKQSYKLGETVPVVVKISTGGHLSAGVDLVLKYDPTKLEVSASSFVPGSIFDDYPKSKIEPNGVLRISGLISANKSGFNGEGEFGTINFSAKASGALDILLDFTPNLTSDSNMVEMGTNKDILQQVTGVKINIE